MSRLACWAVVVVGLISGALCVAQEVEVVHEFGERVVPDQPVEIPNSPKSELILTVKPRIIIQEEEEELIGLPDAEVDVLLRSELIPAPGYGPATLVPVIDGGRMTLRLRSERSAYGIDTDYSVYGSSSPLQNANAQRAALIQSLQALQDAYCRNTQLDEAVAVREMIRQIQTQAEAASGLPEPTVATATNPAEPVYVTDLRGQNDKSFYRKVTGSVGDYVWGGENNIYTDDSLLSAAAVHAGVLKAGEIAMVRFTILPGKDSYIGSTRNGVTTRPYHSFGGSFRIDGAGQELTTVYELRGQDKPPFAVYVVGSLNGSVYGTGSYTDDSDLGTAAVHAGLLKEGEAGFVMVTLEGGKSAYEASTQNGVTTYSYGSWDGAFRLSAFGPATVQLGSHHFLRDVF